MFTASIYILYNACELQSHTAYLVKLFTIYRNKSKALQSNLYYTAKVLHIKAVSYCEGPHLKGSGYKLRSIQSKKNG